MRQVRRFVPVVVWLLGLAAVVAVLQAAGDGTLAGPDLRQPGTWQAWAADRTPADAAMAVVRLVGMALASYLLVVTTVVLAVHAGRWGRAMRVVDVLALPVVRGVVHATLGVGLAGATAASVSAVSPAAPDAPTAADAALIVALPGAATAETLPADDVPPVLRRLDQPAPAPTQVWTVADGDHLWSIAERVLAGAWGRPPTDAEIVPYWTEVIDRNRDRLADPGNPDLIFPGQVLFVPDPGTRI